MNDEKLIEDKKEIEINTRGDEHALRGKIARLPLKIREQLNRRLGNGEPASVILPWVNGLPPVKKILAAYFGGAAINEPNLTAWRHGGFERWLEKQELMAEVRGMAEEAEEWSQATGGGLIRGVARMAAMKLFKVLQEIPAEQRSAADLVKIGYTIAALQNAEQDNEWLEHDKRRVALTNERLTLHWDIHQRDTVAVAERVLDDAIAKKIRKSPYSNEQKRELMGHQIFGHLWQPKEVKEKAKEKPPE
jgi:hypothetical protein